MEIFVRIVHVVPLILVSLLPAHALAAPKDPGRAAFVALYDGQNPRCSATSTFVRGAWAFVYGRCATMKAGMFFRGDAHRWAPADCGLGDAIAPGSSPLTHCRLNASTFRLAHAVVAAGFSPVSKGLRAASKAAAQPEVVIRYVADAEIAAVIRFGSVRGDRPGEHFATNDIYEHTTQALARLALPVAPSERLDMMVPARIFSKSSVVAPMFGQPGGGMERTARAGRVPVIAIKVAPLNAP